MIVFTSFIAAVTNARMQMSKMMGKFEREYWLLRKFCRQNKVTYSLQSRMKRYIDFVLIPAQARLNFEDIALVHKLSPHLRLELATEIHAKCLCLHPLLRYMSQEGRSVMLSICSHAVQDWPLARGDIAFVGGSIAHSMFIVSSGLLEYIPVVKSIGDQEVRIGMFVSEAVLWTEWEHQGQLQASVEGKASVVEGAKFREIVLQSTVLIGVVRSYGTAFCKRLSESCREQGMPTDL
jgi:hypothetical protein